MAEEKKKVETTQNNEGQEMTSKTSKQPENTGTETAPTDKTVETPDGEDFSTAIEVLNAIDKELVGGKGEISDIPEPMRGSIKMIVDQLVFLRDMYRDPLWKAIHDDMIDQKDDGKEPSVLVAFARNVPMEKFEALAENEDYMGAQDELANNMKMEEENKTKMAEEDAMFEEGFQASKAAGEEYAKEMGYDEAEKNELFQFMLDFYKILGDGKLTKDEWSKADKMRNYDKHMEDMRAQIPAEEEPKPVLPDKPSVDTAAMATPRTSPGMGLESLAPAPGAADAANNPYENVGTDIVNRRKRP